MMASTRQFMKLLLLGDLLMDKKHIKEVYDFFNEVGEKFFVMGLVYINTWLIIYSLAHW